MSTQKLPTAFGPNTRTKNSAKVVPTKQRSQNFVTTSIVFVTPGQQSMFPMLIYLADAAK